MNNVNSQTNTQHPATVARDKALEEQTATMLLALRQLPRDGRRRMLSLILAALQRQEKAQEKFEEAARRNGAHDGSSSIH